MSIDQADNQPEEEAAGSSVLDGLGVGSGAVLDDGVPDDTSDTSGLDPNGEA